jgi:hypothetical protein
MWGKMSLIYYDGKWTEDNVPHDGAIDHGLWLGASVI